MTSKRRNVSSGRQTIVHHRTRSTTLIVGREYLEPIPIDLIIEILSRLPAKTIVKCRCVSKRWSSILRLPYFTDLFLTRSYARPQLLFLGHKDGEVNLYTSPQPKNPVESSISLTANYCMRIPSGARYYNRYRRVSLNAISPTNSGLVLITDGLLICNPSTRQLFRVPNMSPSSYFGYDPADKLFKLLSVGASGQSFEHRFLTLGAEKRSWRIIECGVPHYPESDGICINGVLYYQASTNGSLKQYGVICFDVRSEKFSFVSAMETFQRFDGIMDVSVTLVNYKGKLASLQPREGSWNFSGENKKFAMWVLEDPEKQEWSKHVYELPSLWNSVVGNDVISSFVGMTCANEIVLSTCFPFRIFYYNIERKTVTRVEIKGMEAFQGEVYTYLDHVEDVKLMKAVWDTLAQ